MLRCCNPSLSKHAPWAFKTTSWYEYNEAYKSGKFLPNYKERLAQLMFKFVSLNDVKE